MRGLPTLYHELTIALALVFAGALLVVAVGVIVLLPESGVSIGTILRLGALVAADLAIFSFIGRYLIKRRLLLPLDQIVAGVEAIAEGDYVRRLPRGQTSDVTRLAEAVNLMAARVIGHQEELWANIRSLQETNRRLTEARDELVRAEKLASVGRLGAGIAHEIGNPLGAVLGYLGLLGRGADDAKRTLVTAAEGEARRIDRIVRGLLDYARPREARPRAIEVNDVVRETLEFLSTQGRFGEIAVETELGSELPHIVADPYQLQQVLVNLLLNAADALEATRRPSISVRTAGASFRSPLLPPARRRDDPPEVDYSHRRRFQRTGRIPREDPLPGGAEVVEIGVVDNGSGIQEEMLEQIFEPFVTTKQAGKGTGLGLAVSARLVDEMGGTILVESREEQGTTFTIVLPAEIRSAVPAGAG